MTINSHLLPAGKAPSLPVVTLTHLLRGFPQGRARVNICGTDNWEQTTSGFWGAVGQWRVSPMTKAIPTIRSPHLSLVYSSLKTSKAKPPSRDSLKFGSGVLSRFGCSLNKINVKKLPQTGKETVKKSLSALAGLFSV